MKQVALAVLACASVALGQTAPAAAPHGGVDETTRDDERDQRNDRLAQH